MLGAIRPVVTEVGPASEAVFANDQPVDDCAAVVDRDFVLLAAFPRQRNDDRFRQTRELDDATIDADPIDVEVQQIEHQRVGLARSRDRQQRVGSNGSATVGQIDRERVVEHIECGSIRTRLLRRCRPYRHELRQRDGPHQRAQSRARRPGRLSGQRACPATRRSPAPTEVLLLDSPPRTPPRTRSWSDTGRRPIATSP